MKERGNERGGGMKEREGGGRGRHGKSEEDMVQAALQEHLMINVTTVSGEVEKLIK